LAQVRRSRVVSPLIGAGTIPSSFGRNHKTGRIGV
jgi:hypothetical protein